MKAPKRYNQSTLAVLRRSSPYPTLAAMAKAIGLSHASAMQQVEAGRRELSDEKMLALAKALRLPVWRIEAAYLQARREFLRREADQIEARLREVLAKAS